MAGHSREEYRLLAIFEKKVNRLYLIKKLSTRQIAAELGCTQGKVDRALRRFGTPRRDSRTAGLIRRGRK